MVKENGEIERNSLMHLAFRRHHHRPPSMRSQCSPFGRVSMKAMNSSTSVVPDRDAGALTVVSFSRSFQPGYNGDAFPVEFLESRQTKV